MPQITAKSQYFTWKGDRPYQQVGYISDQKDFFDPTKQRFGWTLTYGPLQGGEWILSCRDYPDKWKPREAYLKVWRIAATWPPGTTVDRVMREATAIATSYERPGMVPFLRDAMMAVWVW